MQVSNIEARKVFLSGYTVAFVQDFPILDSPCEWENRTKPGDDHHLVQELIGQIINMPDRTDRIEELRARIASGDYVIPAEEIADAMIRRNVADSVAG